MSTTAVQAAYLAHSRAMRAASEAASDPADKSVYLLLARTYEMLGTPSDRRTSHKLLHRDLDTLKTDTAAALASAAAGPFPPDPNAPRPAPPAPTPKSAPAYFTVDRDGKAAPTEPKPQTSRAAPVWVKPKVPAIDF